jgi:hypothetical protein
MTHKDAGNYSAKHGPESKLSKEAAQAIETKAGEGEITCADAAHIASALNISMNEIGVAVDLMEIRISKCQLGLFGYGKEKMSIKPAKTVSAELEKAVRDALVNGRLSCKAAWEIAQRFGIPKMGVSSACEALKIKIKPCQLGAF